MDSQKPQKPTEQADVAGLESEGVEIVSDIGEVEAPKVTLEKTQEDLRETLAEIEGGANDIFKKAESAPTGRPNDLKAPKLYSTASPFLAPKEEPRKAETPFVPAPHEGSLSTVGSKVLGTGPKEDLKKPIIGAGGRINLQSAIEDMIGSDKKKVEEPKPVAPRVEKKTVDQLQTDSDPSIRAIHTYQSDTEEIVRAQSISVAKMALAEARKNESEGTPIEYVDEEKRIHRKRVLFGTFAVIFLVAGISAVAYVYTQFVNPVNTQQTVVNNATARPLIEVEKTENIDITNSYNPLKSFADTANAIPSDRGILANINLTKKTEAGERLATVEEIFGGNNTEMPFRVVKNVSEYAMFGSLVLKDSTPFIVFKVSSFSNAWAGMLEWEKKMAQDLSPMITAERPDARTDGVFVDEVIANKDARVIKDAAGDILLYSFVNSDILVITTSRSVLKELVRRVTSATIIQ